MTNFTFNSAIPAAPNNPSVDQPDMLTNNISTDGILAIDHISFNTDNGGNHQQVHLVQYTNPTVVSSNAAQGSVVYSAAGIADAAHAQLFFKNPNATYHLSPIRAWGYVDSTGTIIASQSINVTSIVKGGTGIFTVTLTANAVTGSNFAVLVSSNVATPSSNPVTANYSVQGIGTFVCNFTDPATEVLVDPLNFSFQVMQI